MGLLSGLFGQKKEKAKDDFPPVPKWEPSIVIPQERIIDRLHYYADGKKDFVVFKNGTCVLIQDGLNDEEAKSEAFETLSKIINYHPDMNPLNMDDGNILVQYNHPAYNVVLSDIADQNMDTIKERHLDALTRDEVLMTPQGPNKFDEFGMKALWGRCYFFMDAKNPEISKIVRKKG